MPTRGVAPGYYSAAPSVALGDENLEQIAVWRMEGFTNEEIAVKLDCAPRTIERKLRLIRGAWEREQTT